MFTDTIEHDRGGRLPDRPGRHRLTVAGLVAASAGIHLAVTGQHWAESVVFGVFFAVTAVVQLGLAARVAARPVTGRWWWAIVALNVGLVVVWAVARTTGLPIGPEAGHRETILLSDAAATALEIAAGVVAAFSALARGGSRQPDPAPKANPWGRAVALLAVTAAGAAFTLAAASGVDPHHIGVDTPQGHGAVPRHTPGIGR